MNKQKKTRQRKEKRYKRHLYTPLSLPGCSFISLIVSYRPWSPCGQLYYSVDLGKSAVCFLRNKVPATRMRCCSRQPRLLENFVGSGKHDKRKLTYSHTCHFSVVLADFHAK